MSGSEEPSRFGYLLHFFSPLTDFELTGTACVADET